MDDEIITIRHLDRDILNSLLQQAAAHGRSVEAELHAILHEALARPKRKSFKEVLASMPNVGEDADFECRPK